MNWRSPQLILLVMTSLAAMLRVDASSRASTAAAADTTTIWERTMPSADEFWSTAWGQPVPEGAIETEADVGGGVVDFGYRDRQDDRVISGGRFTETLRVPLPSITRTLEPQWIAVDQSHTVLARPRFRIDRWLSSGDFTGPTGVHWNLLSAVFDTRLAYLDESGNLIAAGTGEVIEDHVTSWYLLDTGADPHWRQFILDGFLLLDREASQGQGGPVVMSEASLDRTTPISPLDHECDQACQACRDRCAGVFKSRGANVIEAAVSAFVSCFYSPLPTAGGMPQPLSPSVLNPIIRACIERIVAAVIRNLLTEIFRFSLCTEQCDGPPTAVPFIVIPPNYHCVTPGWPTPPPPGPPPTGTPRPEPEFVGTMNADRTRLIELGQIHWQLPAELSSPLGFRLAELRIEPSDMGPMRTRQAGPNLFQGEITDPNSHLTHTVQYDEMDWMLVYQPGRTSDSRLAAVESRLAMSGVHDVKALITVGNLIVDSTTAVPVYGIRLEASRVGSGRRLGAAAIMGQSESFASAQATGRLLGLYLGTGASDLGAATSFDVNGAFQVADDCRECVEMAIGFFGTCLINLVTSLFYCSDLPPPTWDKCALAVAVVEAARCLIAYVADFKPIFDECFQRCQARSTPGAITATPPLCATITPSATSTPTPSPAPSATPVSATPGPSPTSVGPYCWDCYCGYDDLGAAGCLAFCLDGKQEACESLKRLCAKYGDLRSFCSYLGTPAPPPPAPVTPTPCPTVVGDPWLMCPGSLLNADVESRASTNPR